jgi:hypothetical protein
VHAVVELAGSTFPDLKAGVGYPLQKEKGTKRGGEGAATHGAGLVAGLGRVEPQESRFSHAHASRHVVVALPASCNLVEGPASTALPQNRVVAGHLSSLVPQARVARSMLWKPVWVIRISCVP